MGPTPGEVIDPSTIRTSETRIRTPTGQLPVYAARPAAGPAPGVIVIHEAFGMVEHIRDVVRRFAAAGYLAIAPDLYHVVGAPDADSIDSVMNQMLSLPDEDAMADLHACTTWLRSQAECSGPVGVIGFCSGGRHTLLAACTIDVDAAIDCWGGFAFAASPDAATTQERPVPPADQLDRARCPILLVGGGQDTNPTPQEVETLAQRLRAAGVPVAIHIAEEAGHAFFADYRPSYHEAAAFELWERILEFYERHLQ